jgi:hypothetical protein
VSGSCLDSTSVSLSWLFSHGNVLNGIGVYILRNVGLRINFTIIRLFSTLIYNVRKMGFVLAAEGQNETLRMHFGRSSNVKYTKVHRGLPVTLSVKVFTLGTENTQQPFALMQTKQMETYWHLETADIM